jgi:hypothetical protein
MPSDALHLSQTMLMVSLCKSRVLENPYSMVYWNYWVVLSDWEEQQCTTLCPHKQETHVSIQKSNISWWVLAFDQQVLHAKIFLVLIFGTRLCLVNSFSISSLHIFSSWTKCQSQVSLIDTENHSVPWSLSWHWVNASSSQNAVLPQILFQNGTNTMGLGRCCSCLLFILPGDWMDCSVWPAEAGPGESPF